MFTRASCNNLFFVLLLSASMLSVSSCKKDSRFDELNQNAATSGKETARRTNTIIVPAGTSIQVAVNASPSGSLIKIKPGTYRESITISKPNIALVGEGKVIIENPGTMDIGIVVENGGDGFMLENVTLQNFKERGVQMTGVDGFSLSHVTSIRNGEFGLFAEYCKNGRIEHCEAYGHDETGYFVGYSTNVTVTQNKSYENVIGFEAENSSSVTFDKNHAYNNAVGIMCLLVPGRDIKHSSNITISKNQVDENNHPNFSVPPEKESVLPSGIGILLVGIDNLLVEGNHVRNNKFTGIALVSSLIIGLLSNLPPEAFADIEPNPDGARIVGNKVEGNGFDPPKGLPLPAVDLLWDGSGTNNCWSRNVFNTSYPSPLPGCQ